jgi:SAM-dependent methyltransferase
MPAEAIRKAYQRHGVEPYYRQFGAQYRNPHELAVRRAVQAAVAAWGLDLTRVLDLACGSGEVTLALRDDTCPTPAQSTGGWASRASAGLANDLDLAKQDRDRGATAVEGLDPYTGAAYQARTGQPAEALSFEAIAGGALDGRRYSLVVCSYALHLVPPSRLPRLAYQLSRIAGALLVLTPHKRPHLRPEWGWRLVGEMVVERVRARSYQSTGE